MPYLDVGISMSARYLLGLAVLASTVVAGCCGGDAASVNPSVQGQSPAPDHAVNSVHPPAGFGQPAPDFTVTDTKTGKEVKLSSFKGKPVLLDFWATWCIPCRETLPHTEDIYHQFGKDQLNVLTISDEPESKIARYVKKAGYTFPVYRDTTDQAWKTYHAESIPLIVIIDKNGNMSSYIVGGVSEDTLRHALKKVSVG
jgi:peroxiredoxin